MKFAILVFVLVMGASFVMAPAQTLLGVGFGLVAVWLTQ